jgi:hypothetical protein
MKWILLAGLAAGTLAGAAELKPKTSEAFDRYIRQAEQRLTTRKNFLWSDESAALAKRAKQGEVVVEPVAGKAVTEVPDGLVHDWVGAVFIPGATIGKTIAFMQDYDHKEAFRPEVVASRILTRDGNDFRVYMRLLKKKIIAVVLDSDHEIRYVPVDQTRWSSSSRTTRIVEVKDAGKPDERTLPPGTGNGFLWNLNTYWRFEERDGGAWVECEAVSLTRDVPTGLGWLIEPVVRNLPKESLENTLLVTRKSLAN